MMPSLWSAPVKVFTVMPGRSARICSLVALAALTSFFSPDDVLWLELALSLPDFTAKATIAPANNTSTTVMAIRPHGVCFWLTIDFPGLRAGGRSAGLRGGVPAGGAGCRLRLRRRANGLVALCHDLPQWCLP